MIREKQQAGEMYLSVETEDEFHEALQRGLPIEVTRELARKIGLSSEDVGRAGRDHRGAQGRLPIIMAKNQDRSEQYVRQRQQPRQRRPRRDSRRAIKSRPGSRRINSNREVY